MDNEPDRSQPKPYLQTLQNWIILTATNYPRHDSSPGLWFGVLSTSKMEERLQVKKYSKQVRITSILLD